MKITATVDLTTLVEEGEAISEIVIDAIKEEILRQVRKHPNYKNYVKRAVDSAIAKISE